MDYKIAKFLAAKAFRCAADLNELAPFVKHLCTEEEYRTYSRALASASAHIHLEVVERLFKSHPELEADFESEIKQYGRILG